MRRQCYVAFTFERVTAQVFFLLINSSEVDIYNLSLKIYFKIQNAKLINDESHSF